MLDTLRKRLAKEGTLLIALRVRPGAAKTRLTSTLADGTLKVEIAAQSERGKANAALVRFVADSFGVPLSCVRIVSGTTSRMKKVRVGSPMR